jgi:hypothetical protein
MAQPSPRGSPSLADRKVVPTKLQAMLTPADLKKIERALPDKSTAIIRALKAAGMVGESMKGDRGATSPLGGQAA